MIGAKYFFLTISVFCFLSLNAQNVFTPTQNRGEAPIAFLRDEMVQTETDMENQDEGNLTKEEGEEFYTNSNFKLASFMRSGVVYFGDDYSAYVQKVFNHVKESNPELSDDLEIYVTRIWRPNATSWTNGSLFINLGLLSILENEAQLAFVICHEIAHYEKEHSMKSFKYDVKLKRRNEDSLLRKRLVEDDAIFMNLQYSRKNETEADVEGFRYFNKTQYDPAEAAAALSKLDDIRKDYFSDSLMLHNFLNMNLKETKEFYTEYYQGVGKSKSKSHLELDTFFSTHPDIESRIKKLNIEQAGTKGKKYVVDSAAYADLRSRAWYDMVFALYRAHSYEECFYQSVRLLQQNEDDHYLEEMALNSLYWIMYKIKEQDLKFEFDANDYEDLGYYKYLYLLDALCYDITMLNDFAHAFSKSVLNPERTDALYFSWCRLNYLTNDDTRYFGKYLEKYPAGVYAKYCKKRENYDRK